MKLLSLNVWGGIQGNILFDYIKSNAGEVDIFCFQEVYDSINPPSKIGISGENFALKNDLKSLLPEYFCFYRENIYNAQMSGDAGFDLKYGLCFFVKKNLYDAIIDEGDMIVLGQKKKGFTAYEPVSRNIHYLRLLVNDKMLNIINFHGTWIKDYGENDHAARIEQSTNILNFIKNLDGEVILTGDFNLHPDTESLKMLEGYGLRNLIKDYKISSTRSELYKKSEKFADYTLVSDEVAVNNFSVPYSTASDHLPLVLDFDL